MATDLMPQEGAAQAVPSTAAMATSTMSVLNQHSAIGLHSLRPGTNLKLTADALALATSVRRSRYGRPYVDGFSSDDLLPATPIPSWRGTNGR